MVEEAVDSILDYNHIVAFLVLCQFIGKVEILAQKVMPTFLLPHIVAP